MSSEDEIIKEIFSKVKINIYTVVICSMAITEKIGSSEKKKSQCKSLFFDILDTLFIDHLIDYDKRKNMELIFRTMEGNGLLDDFINSISFATNNPNIINNKWIVDNTLLSMSGACMPCKIKRKLSRK